MVEEESEEIYSQLRVALGLDLGLYDDMDPAATLAIGARDEKPAVQQSPVQSWWQR